MVVGYFSAVQASQTTRSATSTIFSLNTSLPSQVYHAAASHPRFVHIDRLSLVYTGVHGKPEGSILICPHSCSELIFYSESALYHDYIVQERTKIE